MDRDETPGNRHAHKRIRVDRSESPPAHKRIRIARRESPPAKKYPLREIEVPIHCYTDELDNIIARTVKNANKYRELYPEEVQPRMPPFFSKEILQSERRKTQMIHNILMNYNPSSYEEFFRRVTDALRVEALEDIFMDEETLAQIPTVVDLIKKIKHQIKSKSFIRDMVELKEFLDMRNFLFASVGKEGQVARNTSFGFRIGFLKIVKFLHDHEGCSLQKLHDYMLLNDAVFPAYTWKDKKILDDLNFFFVRRRGPTNFHVAWCIENDVEWTKEVLRKHLEKNDRIFSLENGSDGEVFVKLSEFAYQCPFFWDEEALPAYPLSNYRDYSRMQTMLCEIRYIMNKAAEALILEGPFTGKSVYLASHNLFSKEVPIRDAFGDSNAVLLKSCFCLNIPSIWTNPQHNDFVYTACELLKNHNSDERKEMLYKSRNSLKSVKEPYLYYEVEERKLPKKFSRDLKKIRFVDNLLTGKRVSRKYLPFETVDEMKAFIKARAGLYLYQGPVPRCREWDERKDFIDLVHAIYKHGFLQNGDSQDAVFTMFAKDKFLRRTGYKFYEKFITSDGYITWELYGRYHGGSKIFIPYCHTDLRFRSSSPQ